MTIDNTKPNLKINTTKKSKIARAVKHFASLVGGTAFAGDPTPTSVEWTSVDRHPPCQAKNKNRCSHWPGFTNKNCKFTHRPPLIRDATVDVANQ